MTWIVSGYTSKGELKRRCIQGANPRVIDPSIFDPKDGPFKSVVRPGESIVVTNHPKRSWFAKMTHTRDGTIKVE